MPTVTAPPRATPFIKWVGGKSGHLRWLRPRLVGEHPAYHEPCVGGGSVLLDVLQCPECTCHAYFASDLNPWLVGTYVAVQRHLSTLLAELRVLQRAFSTAPAPAPRKGRRSPHAPLAPSLAAASELSREEVFYWARGEFNRLTASVRHAATATAAFVDGEPIGLTIAALFIFLNKTAFRGVYRENARGEMNVPYGNPPATLQTFDEANLCRVSAVLQPVQFFCQPFETALGRVSTRDVVYLDPPYAPTTTTKTTSFVGYTANGFCDDDTRRLLALCHTVVQTTGATVLMSNSSAALVWTALSKGRFDGRHTASSVEWYRDDVHYTALRVCCRRAIQSNNPAAKENEVIVFLQRLGTETGTGTETNASTHATLTESPT